MNTCKKKTSKITAAPKVELACKNWSREKKGTQVKAVHKNAQTTEERRRTRRKLNQRRNQDDPSVRTWRPRREFADPTSSGGSFSTARAFSRGGYTKVRWAIAKTGPNRECSTRLASQPRRNTTEGNRPCLPSPSVTPSSSDGLQHQRPEDHTDSRAAGPQHHDKYIFNFQPQHTRYSDSSRTRSEGTTDGEIPGLRKVNALRGTHTSAGRRRSRSARSGRVSLSFLNLAEKRRCFSTTKLSPLFFVLFLECANLIGIAWSSACDMRISRTWFLKTFQSDSRALFNNTSCFKVPSSSCCRTMHMFMLAS